MKIDSRKVVKGDTFIALRGVDKDGHDYIEEAILNGASKIICEEGNYSVKTIHVKDTRKYLIKYLHKKYDKKLSKMKIIGVTGTNGKTSTCYLTYQLLNSFNIKTAYIGTIGFYVDGKVKDLDNTTSDIFYLYEMFNYAYLKKCEVIIMEVSSQALEYNRLGKIKFDIACFTNLSMEHLDFHKNMDNYCNSKLKLFNKLKNNKIAIINVDNNYSNRFILKNNKNILFGSSGEYKITHYKLYDNYSIFTLIKDKAYIIKLPYLGKYNIYNYVLSLIITNQFNIKIEDIIKKKLSLPSGRYEVIKYKKNNIIIDFAHTPDAVANIINTVKEYNKGKIYVVIGCGGNRDKEKRPKMGLICLKNAYHTIFTNDNPRFEDEKQIINDMINIKFNNYSIIYDRKKAIEKGIDLLNINDTLLILGKGHEEYQIIKNNKLHFSDKETVINYIK